MPPTVAQAARTPHQSAGWRCVDERGTPRRRMLAALKPLHRPRRMVLACPPSRDPWRHACRQGADIDVFAACPAMVDGQEPCSKREDVVGALPAPLAADAVDPSIGPAGSEDTVPHNSLVARLNNADRARGLPVACRRAAHRPTRRALARTRSRGTQRSFVSRLKDLALPPISRRRQDNPPGAFPLPLCLCPCPKAIPQSWTTTPITSPKVTSATCCATSGRSVDCCASCSTNAPS